MLIDHLHGRRVTGVIARGKADWGIQLEGDVIIWNTDARRTAVPDEGALLTLSLISSTDWTASDDGDNIDLDFGTVAEDGSISNAVSLSFTGSQHRIAGPGSSGVEESVEIPPSPEERIADGPSQEWIDEQQETDEAAHAEWVENTSQEGAESDSEATDA